MMLRAFSPKLPIFSLQIERLTIELEDVLRRERGSSERAAKAVALCEAKAAAARRHMLDMKA